MANPLSRLKSIGIKRFLFVLIFLSLIGAAGFSFMKYREAQAKLSQLSTPEGQRELAEKEVNTLLDKVKKHMVLPSDEEPTIATVTDAENLKKNQPFFEHAENGDRVLVYVKARKAIIFSPTKDIVVNVGNVAVDEQPQAAQDTPSPEATPDVQE